MWRLVLVDGHAMFREGLRALLRGQPDLELVGEAADAREAYLVVDERGPDVAIVDAALPGSDGFAAARELLHRAPRTRSLLLCGRVAQSEVARALGAGAAGVAMKSQRSSELFDAVRAVAAGQRYLPPPLAVAVAERAPPEGGPLAALSPREREVFDLLVRGGENRQIARRLTISIKTVETHRSRVLKKLNVHSIAALVRLAAAHGWTFSPAPDGETALSP